MKNYQDHAAATLKTMNVKFTVAPNPLYGFHFEEDKQRRYIFTVKFSRGGKSFSLKFGQSIAKGGEEPTAYDVIACLQKYDVGSFNDFCNEFGYNTDSIKSLKTYKAVCKEYDKVSNFFTQKEIKDLSEIW